MAITEQSKTQIGQEPAKRAALESIGSLDFPIPSANQRTPLDAVKPTLQISVKEFLGGNGISSRNMIASVLSVAQDVRLGIREREARRETIITQVAELVQQAYDPEVKQVGKTAQKKRFNHWEDAASHAGRYIAVVEQIGLAIVREQPSQKGYFADAIDKGILKNANELGLVVDGDAKYKSAAIAVDLMRKLGQTLLYSYITESGQTLEPEKRYKRAANKLQELCMHINPRLTNGEDPIHAVIAAVFEVNEFFDDNIGTKLYALTEAIQARAKGSSLTTRIVALGSLLAKGRGATSQDTVPQQARLAIAPIDDMPEIQIANTPDIDEVQNLPPEVERDEDDAEILKALLFGGLDEVSAELAESDHADFSLRPYFEAIPPKKNAEQIVQVSNNESWRLKICTTERRSRQGQGGMTKRYEIEIIHISMKDTRQDIVPQHESEKAAWGWDIRMAEDGEVPQNSSSEFGYEESINGVSFASGDPEGTKNKILELVGRYINAVEEAAFRDPHLISTEFDKK